MPRHQPLRGGLFVARRAVDLPCEIQPADKLSFLGCVLAA